MLRLHVVAESSLKLTIAQTPLHSYNLENQEMVGAGTWVFKIIPSMVSSGINCGTASPPHAADKHAGHMMRNLGPFLYECMS